jgi:hypothetical protein
MVKYLNYLKMYNNIDPTHAIRNRDLENQVPFLIFNQIKN